MSRKNNFDLIRLVAAFLIMVFHTMAHMHVVPEAGLPASLFLVMLCFPGVPAFFVISGFLISASWERKPDLKLYWENRALRIYPALVVCLFVSIILMLSLRAISPRQLVTAPYLGWLAAQLTIGQTLNIGMFRHYGVGNPNGSLWTIPVELEFYALLPFLYIVGRKLRSFQAVLIALVAASLAIDLLCRSSGSAIGRYVHATILSYFWVFGLGILIQTHFEVLRKYLEGKAVYWVVGFVAAIWALNRINMPFVEPAVWAMLAPVTISIAYTKPDLSAKLLKGVDISYGTYLFHMLWVNAAIQIGLVGPGWPVAAVFALTVGSALLSWFLIEKKALSMKPKIAFESLGKALEH